MTEEKPDAFSHWRCLTYSEFMHYWAMPITTNSHVFFQHIILFVIFFVRCYSEASYVCHSSSNSWYLQKWIEVIAHNNASICNMKDVIPYKRKRLSSVTADAWYRHFDRVNENNLHCWTEKCYSWACQWKYAVYDIKLKRYDLSLFSGHIRNTFFI